MSFQQAGCRRLSRTPATRHLRGWRPAVFPSLHAGRDNTEADTHRRLPRGCIFGPGCNSRRLQYYSEGLSPSDSLHRRSRGLRAALRSGGSLRCARSLLFSHGLAPPCSVVAKAGRSRGSFAPLSRAAGSDSPRPSLALACVAVHHIDKQSRQSLRLVSMPLTTGNPIRRSLLMTVVLVGIAGLTGVASAQDSSARNSDAETLAGC